MIYQIKKCFLWLIVLMPFSIFSQTEEVIEYSDATITTEYCVTINTDNPIAEHYVMDISHLHLVTEIDANDKFGYICNNLLTYTVDVEANEAYLQIHLDRTPEPKDVIWWNDYINSLCGL